MATWILEAFTIPVDTTVALWQALVALAVMIGGWAVTLYRVSSIDRRLTVLEGSIQNPETRAAEAKLIHTEFEAHAREDKLEFTGIKNRIDRIEEGLGGIHGKLDRILESVNHK